MNDTVVPVDTAALPPPMPGMRALALFGREVLSIMATSEGWSSDTTQAIADLAHNMKLWFVDSLDGSLCLSENLPEIPPPLNDRDQAMVVASLSMMRSDSNEGHPERRPGGHNAFTDEELDALIERIRTNGMSLSDSLGLDERELAIVLAALRAGAQDPQMTLDQRFPGHFDGIEGGTVQDDEIHELCERLNC